MEKITIDQLYQGRAALVRLLANQVEAVPSHIRELILDTRDGDLPAEIELVRSIYDADRGDGDDDTVGPHTLNIAGAMAGVIADRAFYDVGRDGTAAKMRGAMLRDAGVEAPEGMAWPLPENDPPKRGAAPVEEPPAE